MVFSNIVLQKHILDAGQLFPFPCVWNDCRSDQRKILKGKDCFLDKIRLLIIYLLKKIKEDHTKPSKVDNLNFHRKRSFIDH